MQEIDPWNTALLYNFRFWQDPSLTVSDFQPLKAWPLWRVVTKYWSLNPWPCDVLALNMAGSTLMEDLWGSWGSVLGNVSTLLQFLAKFIIPVCKMGITTSLDVEGQMKTRVAGSTCLEGRRCTSAVLSSRQNPGINGLVYRREWFHDRILTGIPSKGPRQRPCEKREHSLSYSFIMFSFSKMLRVNRRVDFSRFFSFYFS